MKKVFILFFGFLVFCKTDADFTIIRNIIDSGTETNCSIIKVDDGDTLDVSCQNHNQEKYFPNIRLIGINAPDLDWNGEYKYRHCYYNESKSALNSIKNRRFDMIFYGSDLCKDDEKGCRNLVRLSDHITGSDINELLILKGYAFSWTNFSSIPLDLKIKYIKAERRAKESGSGLWGKCETSFNFLAKIDSSIPTKMTK